MKSGHFLEFGGGAACEHIESVVWQQKANLDENKYLRMKKRGAIHVGVTEKTRASDVKGLRWCKCAADTHTLLSTAEFTHHALPPAALDIFLLRSSYMKGNHRESPDRHFLELICEN